MYWSVCLPTVIAVWANSCCWLHTHSCMKNAIKEWWWFRYVINKTTIRPLLFSVQCSSSVLLYVHGDRNGLLGTGSPADDIHCKNEFLSSFSLSDLFYFKRCLQMVLRVIFWDCRHYKVYVLWLRGKLAVRCILGLRYICRTASKSESVDCMSFCYWNGVFSRLDLKRGSSYCIF